MKNPHSIRSLAASGLAAAMMVDNGWMHDRPHRRPEPPKLANPVKRAKRRAQRRARKLTRNKK